MCEHVDVQLPRGFNLDDRSLWPRINFVSRKVMKLGPQHRALMDKEIKEIMCAVRTIRNSKRYRRKKAAIALVVAEDMDTPSPSF